jgi:hypothetical protein
MSSFIIILFSVALSVSASGTSGFESLSVIHSVKYQLSTSNCGTIASFHILDYSEFIVQFDGVWSK